MVNCNQNPYIEDEQTTQWPKEKVQKDKQRYTKHTHKTKDWVTRTPLKTVGELRCSGRVSSSYSTSDTRRVNLVTNPVVSQEWGKDGKCLRQVEHIRGHLWHRYSIAVNQVVVATVKFLKWWLQLYQEVASLLATTLYQGNPGWNILSERANFSFFFKITL